MIGDINNKIIKLEKKRLVVQILSIVFWILAFKISADSINYIMPMVKLINLMANNYIEINSIYGELLLSFMSFVYRYLPSIVYVGGRVFVYSISREIRKLEIDKMIVVENEKKKKELDKKMNSTELIRIYDIVDRFEALPRGKQMEVLNYIKGDLAKQNNDLYESIGLLNDEDRELLQTECEDILFPVYEDEKDYSKKKKM